jgi:hypothetical protein
VPKEEAKRVVRLVPDESDEEDDGYGIQKIRAKKKL